MVRICDKALEEAEHSRFSNSNVESWFKEVKKTVLQNRTHETIGRFVRLLVRYVRTTYKQIALRIPEQACNKPRKWPQNTHQRKRKADQSELGEFILKEDDPNIQEIWMRRPKKKRTYFQNRFCDVLPSKVKANFTSNVTPVRKSYGPVHIQLSQFDYDSIKDGGWLTDLVIDAVMEEVLLKDQNKVVYAKSSTGQLLFTDSFLGNDCYITMESLVAANYFLLPYNVSNNHWCLLIADMSAKRMYCFDSLPKSKPKSASSLKAVMNLFKRLNEFAEKAGRVTAETQQINIQHWQDCTDMIQYPKQKDGFNCGVYIIYYRIMYSNLGCHLLPQFQILT